MHHALQNFVDGFGQGHARAVWPDQERTSRLAGTGQGFGEVAEAVALIVGWQHGPLMRRYSHGCSYLDAPTSEDPVFEKTASPGCASRRHCSRAKSRESDAWVCC